MKAVTLLEKGKIAIVDNYEHGKTLGDNDVEIEDHGLRCMTFPMFTTILMVVLALML